MKFTFGNDPLVSSIYKIENIETKKIYIGQAKFTKFRWDQHKECLEKNKHYNTHLQFSYNKYKILFGHSDFLVFTIIESLPNSTKKTRNEREWYWIKEHVNTHELYNMILASDERMEMSDNLKEQIKKSKKDWYQTKEGKALIEKNREAKLGKTYEELYGKERAEEIKKLISDHKIVEMNKPEVKQHLSEMHMGKTFEDRFGKEHAEQILEKMSVARKGKYTGKDSSRFRVFEDIRLISNDGKVYTRIEGIKEFAEEHGLSKNHLCELLAGKRKSHKGWTLE